MITAADVEKAVQGNLEVIPRIAAASHGELTEAWRMSRRPMLTALAVVRVIEALLDRQANEHWVQQWASLVMRGYLETIGPPLRPIDIAYQPEFEEEMAEVVSRLEQLGDLVDGTPDEPLLRTLILPLKTRPRAQT
jgi:hypothetical protein